MQAIPLPPTNTLNPDGSTTTAPSQPTAPSVPSVPSNPPTVPSTPIVVPTITPKEPKPTNPPPTKPVTPPSTSVPSVVLVQPYVDPPGMTRIYKTEDAYQVGPDTLNTYIFTYALGTDAAPTRASFFVKNLCTLHTLGVTLNLPQFLDTSVGDTFLLSPLESQVVDLVVSETGSINLIEQRKTTLQEPLIVSVEVLNVTGPVYVQTPGVVPPTTTPDNGETINTDDGPVTIPPGLTPEQRRQWILKHGPF